MEEHKQTPKFEKSETAQVSKPIESGSDISEPPISVEPEMSKERSLEAPTKPAPLYIGYA